MGTLLATFLALGGIGGFGWWWVRRNNGGAAPPAQPAPLALPPPADNFVPEAFAPENNVEPPRARAPSDFVQRLRRWLEQRPPAEQIELMASHLEQAGHRQTAEQLRACARERREQVAPRPMGPTGQPSVPGGSSESPSDPGSGDLPNSGNSNGAQSEPSSSQGGGDRELRRLARRVAAMLQARPGQSIDQTLVRRFQRTARLFPDREEPSGLYGPVTRDALARYGVRRPPRPRSRAELEAGPSAPNAPPPNNDPNTSS